MRLLIATQSRADPSFRVRWERFLPALAEDGWSAEVRAFAAGKRAVVRAAAAADVVVLHRRLLTRLDFRRLRRAARRLVYDFDDALCYRPRDPHRSRTRAARFFRTVAAADLVSAGNRVLAGIARLRARRVVVLPSTVAPTAAAPKADAFTAVWIGQRATLPHLETVRTAVLDAGVALRVVADEAPPGTEFVEWSVDGEAAALASAHVGLMPLPRTPYARGKCGYKLLQYYAAGLPAIASPVGVNRVLAGGGALLADAPAAWADALARLREDADLRARLGAKGRDFVARRYAPASLAVRLRAALRAAAT